MILALLLAGAAISVHSNFEGGNIGRVEIAAPNHLRCAVIGEKDQDGRNRQASWYYFLIDTAPGRDIIVDLIDLPGEYNYQPNRGAINAATIPVVSSDNIHWDYAKDVTYDEKEPYLRIRLRTQSRHTWIARLQPYTTAHYRKLIAATGASPLLKRSIVGKSVEGRPLPLIEITDPAVPIDKKQVVALMFRQHSWETGSSWVGDGAVRYLTSPDAAPLRRRAHFLVFPYCDPDGIVKGGVRFNRHGYDLNRNWDVPDSPKMPEIAAHRNFIYRWLDAGKPVHFFLTVHNTETAEYLDGPPSGAEDLLKRLYNTLRNQATFAPTRPPQNQEPTTTTGKPGRMNVAQGLWHSRKLNAFLMEQRIAFNEKLGRLATIEDRQKFGAELVQKIVEVLEK